MRTTSGRGGGSSVPLVKMMGVLSCLVITGVFFCATLAPSELAAGPSTNSILVDHHAGYSARALSQKIMDWLPKHHAAALQGGEGGDGGKPDYSQEFWSPIDVDVSHDSVVTLCKLNFRAYGNSPHKYPMFKDLEANSACVGSNRRREKLAVLIDEIKLQAGTSGGSVIEPTGFVFHESRVGSTLVANTLASDPFSMVFSESAPAANALLHCDSCTRERNVQLFRDVVTLMGRSPIHKRLFFKFQSITSTKMEIALEAFPNTPFVFVYRQPVQTMMSHLDPLKGSSGAPCLRSMRSPPAEVRETIASAVLAGQSPPREAWCAAHLNMLCNSALHAYEKFGVRTDSAGTVTQRGLLVNYEALPGIVPRAILPMFGVDPYPGWLTKMEQESKQYSKGRGGNTKIFKGDSQDKDERATRAIQKYAKAILEPTYTKLLTASEESLKGAAPQEYAGLTAAENGASKDWKPLAKIPTKVVTRALNPQRDADTEVASQALGNAAAAAGAGAGAGVVADDKAVRDLPDLLKANLRGAGIFGHSKVLKPKTFVPWIPFTNTHTSKSLHVSVFPLASCSLVLTRLSLPSPPPHPHPHPQTAGKMRPCARARIPESLLDDRHHKQLEHRQH